MAKFEDIHQNYLDKGPVAPDAFGGHKLYAVEGDLLVDELALEDYARARAQREAGVHDPDAREGLIAMTDAQGRIIRWRPGLTLTYAVRKGTFTTEERYNTAVAAIATATAGWASLCGVEFQHLQDLDTDLDPTGRCLFTVREVPQSGSVIAAAFFPDDPVWRRQVIIMPSFFSVAGFDPVGVLRHELGHVLGFRHEHILSNAPALCPDEDLDNILPLTRYDPKSVMHYFCGGAGTTTLEFTQIDQEGVLAVYGPPHSRFTYFE